MNAHFLASCFAISLGSISPVNAQTEADRLGDCLVQSSTGAQRLALARWIAHAIISHPNVRDSVAAPRRVLEEVDQGMAEIFTNLVSTACRDESRAAFQMGGNSVELAFETLGRIAMLELMSNPDVNTRIESFIQYLDEDDFNFLD